ncbi:transposase family protein [Streptomyces gardneri]|uniref:transposase family protein n=1 Tax=Streptomyces gardneri TaxID=66892 RepID=UPI00367FE8BF
MVEVVARGRAAGAACPDCGRFADRVHDRYQRRLRDLPLADQGFVIRLTARRFICGSADRPRRTFAEPLSRRFESQAEAPAGGERHSNRAVFPGSEHPMGTGGDVNGGRGATRNATPRRSSPPLPGNRAAAD